MIQYKELKIFCVALLLQFQKAYCQWHVGRSGPIFYVPPSAPPEYTRVVQGYPIENSRQFQQVRVSPPVEVPSTLGILPPTPPLPGGVPLGTPQLYEGQYQAAAAAAAHPNQPVIIINNGDYGTKKEDKGGLFGGDGGDLLALLLATHGHHGHGHPAEYEPEPLPTSPLPLPPQTNGNFDNGGRNNGPININITIVLPSSKSENNKNETEDD